MTEIISVRFKEGGKSYYFNPNGLSVVPGDRVIIETSRGVEFGECVEGNRLIDEMELVSPLRPVLRKATEADFKAMEQNKEKEQKAFQICQQKIQEHGLDMKLVEVEYNFDGSKILFFFTSEGRVDFRALVRDLASVFHTRIELRQIGVRDEAKMLGGLGVCGRPYCCSAFLSDFHPVSIKMAKTQNLSLNPTKISGACGRLMCCLKYEQEAYEDVLKRTPKLESLVETPDGVGTVNAVQLLREKVKVRLDNDPDNPRVYSSGDITVIRSGKGKRPEGYELPDNGDKPQKSQPQRLKAEAPASQKEQQGQPSRRASQPKPEQQAAHKGAEIPAATGTPAPGAQEGEVQKAPRRRHRSHRRSSGQKAPGENAAPQQAQKAEAPKGEAGEKSSGGQQRSRRHRSRRRPSGGGNKGEGGSGPKPQE